MTLFWSLVFVSLVVAGWYWFEGGWDRKLFHAEPGRVCVNLSGERARAWLQEHPETQVLDVRSAREFAEGALPGAINVSIDDAEFDIKLAVLDKSKPVLVYCAGGFRSRKAVVRLKELGYENIQHIHRGYLSWKANGASVT